MVWGEGGFGESITKRKLMTKNLFSNNGEWSSKNEVVKSQSADVNADVKQLEIKELVAVSCNFL